MTPQDNSLRKYNYGLTNSGQPANNFNRPNVTNFKPESGRLYQTQYENIMTSSPKVYWNSYNTKDPILNFGSTSTDIGGAGFLETMGKIASGITLFGGMAMTGLGIANAVQTIKAAKNNQQANGTNNFSRKENKFIDKNTVNGDNTMNALDSAITTAENLDESVSQETAINAGTNLNNALNEARNVVKNAKLERNEAEEHKRTLTNEKSNLEVQRDGLKNEKTSYENELAALEKKDPSELTESDKIRINELKKLIKEQEKKIEDIEEQIAKKQSEINVENEIITRNTTTINNLEQNIAQGDKLAAKLKKQVDGSNQ